MRRRAAVVVIAFLVSACGVIPGFGSGVPSWCGAVGSGGGPVLPPDTPRPISTPDPHTLRCVGVENHSEVDVALVAAESWSLIAACTGMAASEPIPSGPWTIEIYRATPGGTTGPALATFDSEQLTGNPPYLISISVGADMSVTAHQVSSLADPARRFC